MLGWWIVTLWICGSCLFNKCWIMSLRSHSCCHSEAYILFGGGLKRRNSLEVKVDCMYSHRGVSLPQTVQMSFFSLIPLAEMDRLPCSPGKRTSGELLRFPSCFISITNLRGLIKADHWALAWQEQAHIKVHSCVNDTSSKFQITFSKLSESNIAPDLL